MSNNDKTSAILLIAGSGERFKSPIPKQFHRLSGKKIYLYTLEALIKAELFSEIILVCHESYVEEVKSEVSGYKKAFIKVVKGAATRQQSSYLGIRAVSQESKYVLIHDGVRPFVSCRVLQKNVEKVRECLAIDTCIHSTDTIVHSSNGLFINSIPNRKELLRGQTPQTFEISLIKKAHEKAISDNIVNATCDCSLVNRLGHSIGIVEGDDHNIKITSELDIFIAEQLLRKTSIEQIPKGSNSLKGKIFVITGASGSIGTAITKALETAGAQVLAVSRSSPYSCDLNHPDIAEKTFNQIEKECGAIDGLINCVGSLLTRRFENYSVQEIDDLVKTNFSSVLYACKFANIKQGGHIINFASSSYLKGRKEMAPYSASKAAIVNFTQALAEERTDLCINVIAPKRTLSEMRKREFLYEDEKELLDPNLIAQKVLSLLSCDKLTGNLFSLF